MADGGINRPNHSVTSDDQRMPLVMGTVAPDDISTQIQFDLGDTCDFGRSKRRDNLMHFTTAPIGMENKRRFFMKNLALPTNWRAMLFIALVGSLFLPGCSSLDTQEVDWDHGAKRAWVAKIYSSAELHGENIPSCLNSVPETGRLYGQYAEVSIGSGRLRKWKPAKIADGLTVKAGDEVELYPTECSLTSIPVIRKLLRSSSSEGANGSDQ